MYLHPLEFIREIISFTLIQNEYQTHKKHHKKLARFFAISVNNLKQYKRIVGISRMNGCEKKLSFKMYKIMYWCEITSVRNVQKQRLRCIMRPNDPHRFRSDDISCVLA